MKSVHEGDTLVVWKLDRLARSARQLIDTLDALRERGAAFRSLTDALDTATPRGGVVTFSRTGQAKGQWPATRHAATAASRHAFIASERSFW
jgi:phosphatidylserine/phosphatidylglycerophosphate/cardiolipin synthase-like enzyme